MNYHRYIQFAFLFIIIASCKKEDSNTNLSFECVTENTEPKGNRLIGIDLLDLSESGSFDDNLALASELGIEFIALHLPWNSIETAPNNYVVPEGALEALNQVALSNNLKFSLTIRPI